MKPKYLTSSACYYKVEFNCLVGFSFSTYNDRTPCSHDGKSSVLKGTLQLFLRIPKEGLLGVAG